METDAAVDEGDDGRLTAAQLEEALPKVEQLPTGFSLDPDQDDDSDDDDDTGDDCSRRYDALSPDSEEENKASRDYLRGELEFLTVGLASAPDAQAAEQRMNEFRALADECPSFTSVSDGEKLTITLQPLSFPKIGDQTTALRMSAKQGDFTLGFYGVFARTGQEVATILHGGLTLPDVGDTEQVVRTSVENLERLG